MKLTLNTHLDSEIPILKALNLSSELQLKALMRVRSLKKKFVIYLREKRNRLEASLEKNFLSSLEEVKDVVIKEINSLRMASEIEIHRRTCALSLKILTQYCQEDPNVILNRIEKLIPRISSQRDFTLIVSEETQKCLEKIHASIKYPILISHEMDPGDITLSTQQGSLSLLFDQEINNAS